MAIQSSPRFGVGPRLGIEVVGLVAAVAAGIGIGALAFDGSGSTSSPGQVVVNPALAAPPVIASSPGVGAVSEGEFLRSAFGLHESFMEALFGPYRVDRPTEANEAPALDIAAARAEHDNLIPSGGN